MTDNTNGQITKVENTGNTVDVGTDWKTYSDVTIGISFNYPANWELSNYDSNSAEKEVIVSPPDALLYPFFSVIPDIQYRDIDQIRNEFKTSQGGNLTYTEKSIVVDG